MSTTIMSRGNSPTAAYLNKISQDHQSYFAQTAAFSKQPAIEELLVTWEESKITNWDGDDAFPVQTETLNYTYAFIQALPLGFPLPSVSAEPDGHLALDWYQNPHWTLSVSMSPAGILYYAALLGNRDPRGSEPFFGTIPKQILSLIQEVALAKH
jgi:hypothetical protein